MVFQELMVSLDLLDLQAFLDPKVTLDMACQVVRENVALMDSLDSLDSLVLRVIRDNQVSIAP